MLPKFLSFLNSHMASGKNITYLVNHVFMPLYIVNCSESLNTKAQLNPSTLIHKKDMSRGLKV